MGVSQSVDTATLPGAKLKAMNESLLKSLYLMVPNLRTIENMFSWMGYDATPQGKKGGPAKPFQIVLVGLDGAGKTTLTQRFKVVHQETLVVPAGAPTNTGAAGTCDESNTIGEEMQDAGLPYNANNTPILPEDGEEERGGFRAQHPEPAPTIGLNLEKVQLSEHCVVEVWDLGGQQSMRHLWQHYLYDKVDLLVFMVDAADVERIPVAMEELAKLQTSQDLKRSAPYTLVLLNKCDRKVCDGETQQNPATATTDDGDCDVRRTWTTPGAISEAAFNKDFLTQQVLESHESTGYPLCVKSISALTGEGVEAAVQWITSALNAKEVIQS